MKNQCRYASRLENLGTENAFDVLKDVNALKRSGVDVVSFAIGEPDFDTPSNIAREGIRALASGSTHYTESQGVLKLRETCAEYFNDTRGTSVGPENICVVPGGKPTIFFAMMATIEAGDEVICPCPGYPIYESLINFFGGKVIPLYLEEDEAFAFNVSNFETLITSKTKMIVLNFPNNPTGGCLKPKHLQAVSRIARENGIWILSDEIYSRLVYDAPLVTVDENGKNVFPKFDSVSAYDPEFSNTIILEGFSKTYAMTGWRLGYGVMSSEMAGVVAKLMTNCASCTCEFTQLAGIEALTGNQEESNQMVRMFKARRDLMCKLVNNIPGFSCKVPGGAFYVWANVTELCEDYGFVNAKQLMNFLLYKANVAVLHRGCFGKMRSTESKQFIRFSFATSAEEIKRGIARIAESLKDKEMVKLWLEGAGAKIDHEVVVIQEPQRIVVQIFVD